MELSPSWETVSCAAIQEHPRSFWNTKVHWFIRAHHWSLSWTRSIQSIPPHPISLKCILILSTHLHLSLSFWLSHQYPICIPLHSHSCYMFCPSHSPWLDHSNWRSVQVMKLIIMQFSSTSNLLSLHISSIQIFSSATYSETLPVYVPPLVSETMFHTHIEPEAKL
jgi:hypothetical protein